MYPWQSIDRPQTRGGVHLQVESLQRSIWRRRGICAWKFGGRPSIPLLGRTIDRSSREISSVNVRRIILVEPWIIFRQSSTRFLLTWNFNSLLMLVLVFLPLFPGCSLYKRHRRRIPLPSFLAFYFFILKTNTKCPIESNVSEQKTFKSVNDQLSNLQKGKIPMRSYSFSWKKRITFSVRKSREFSPIFPNIVNNSRGRRKFSFYLELEIHQCAWYASFCSVIVHRSNYRSSLIKSLSLSLRNNCRPSLRKYLRK